MSGVSEDICPSVRSMSEDICPVCPVLDAYGCPKCPMVSEGVQGCPGQYVRMSYGPPWTRNGPLWYSSHQKYVLWFCVTPLTELLVSVDGCSGSAVLRAPCGLRPCHTQMDTLNDPLAFCIMYLERAHNPPGTSLQAVFCTQNAFPLASPSPPLVVSNWRQSNWLCRHSSIIDASSSILVTVYKNSSSTISTSSIFLQQEMQ